MNLDTPPGPILNVAVAGLVMLALLIGGWLATTAAWGLVRFVRGVDELAGTMRRVVDDCARLDRRLAVMEATNRGASGVPVPLGADGRPPAPRPTGRFEAGPATE